MTFTKLFNSLKKGDKQAKSAWSRCIHGDWMAWIAVRVGIDRSLVLNALGITGEGYDEVVNAPNSLEAASNIDRHIGYEAIRVYRDTYESTRVSFFYDSSVDGRSAESAANSNGWIAKRNLFRNYADSIRKHIPWTMMQKALKAYKGEWYDA